MSAPLRPAASRLGLSCPFSSATPRRCFTCSVRLAKNEQWPQRSPLGAYYSTILNDPTLYLGQPSRAQSLPSSSPSPGPSFDDAPKKPKPQGKKKPGRKPKIAPIESVASPNPSAGTSPPVPSPPPKSAAEKARIVFGSRLLGPAEQADRLATKRSQSSYVAGVLVPPRPEEPDNCCMSGCVNCVWDRFREDMEEWTAKKSQAQRRLKQGSHGDSVDSDGGRTDVGLNMPMADAHLTHDMWNDDIFKTLPVGIREFMKQEKRLKEKHERERSVAG